MYKKRQDGYTEAELLFTFIIVVIVVVGIILMFERCGGYDGVVGGEVDVYVYYETEPVYGFRFVNGQRVRYVRSYRQYRVRKSRTGLVLGRAKVPYKANRVGSRYRTASGKYRYRSSRKRIRVRSTRYRSTGGHKSYKYRSRSTSGSRYRSRTTRYRSRSSAPRYRSSSYRSPSRSYSRSGRR